MPSYDQLHRNEASDQIIHSEGYIEELQVISDASPDAVSFVHTSPDLVVSLSLVKHSSSDEGITEYEIEVRFSSGSKIYVCKRYSEVSHAIIVINFFSKN